MVPVGDFAWRNDVDVAGQKNRSASAGSGKRSGKIRAATEISTLLCTRFASVDLQKGVCIRLPEIGFESGGRKSALQVILTFSFARAGLARVSSGLSVSKGSVQDHTANEKKPNHSELPDVVNV